MATTWRRRHVLEAVFTVACTALAASILLDPDAFGSLAGRDANIALGVWGARFLVVSLALSPLARLLHKPAIKMWRRPFGLAAFAFSLAHTVQYLAYSGIWPEHMQILVRRPYLLIGVIALVLMLPLALTSFNRAIAWMGPGAWRRLHWAVYLIVPLALVHDVMAFAPFWGEAGLLCLVTTALLAERLAVLGRSRARARAPSAPGAR